jgi:hypothetical protein
MANRRFIDFPIASTVGENDIVLIWQSGANKQTTKATLLSGVAKQLNDLTDVTITSLANGQILQYDSVTGQWINVDRTDINLSELGDVSIISPTNGQVLVYNSSTAKWENSSGGYVPYVGAVTTVDLGLQGLEAGFIRLDTSITSPPTGQGTMYWDQDEETVAIILNGSTTKVGEDIFFQVKNQSGATIPKGTAVRFDGVVGASGRIKIVPFLANGSNPSIYFLGVTYEAIADGADGKALFNGKIRGVNTSAFAVGDILYASPTVAGGFTTTKPVAPNNIISFAAVLSSGANGILLIRPQIGSNINNDEGVKITSPTTGDLLQLQASGLWENKTKAQILNGNSLQFVKGDGSLDSTSYQPLLTNPITGSIATGQVAFGTAAGVIGGDSGLTWNNTTKRLSATNDVVFNGVNIGRGGGNNQFNTRLGFNALSANTTGRDNVAFGWNALSANTTGNNNTAVGSATLSITTTSSNNVAVGFRAGRLTSTGGNVDVANNSVFIGALAFPLLREQTNQIVIGYNAIGLGSNSVVLGNDSITFTGLKGNVGVNTTTNAGFRLDVNGTARVQGNLTISAGGYIYGDTTNPYVRLSNSAGLEIGYGTSYLSIGGAGFSFNTTSSNRFIFYRTTSGMRISDQSALISDPQSDGLQAVLALTSTNKGFLPPRMTATQRAAIASPATGLQLYNTTNNTPDYYNGTSWNSVIAGSGTTNYLAKFTAAGTVGDSQVFDNGTNVGIGTDSPSLLFSVLNKVGVDNDGRLFWGSDFSGNNRGLLTWEANSARIQSGSTSTSLDFAIGTGDIRMRLSTNNNLLINTTADAGFKLDVNGTGRFSGNVTVGTTLPLLLSNDISQSQIINGIYYNTDNSGYGIGFGKIVSGTKTNQLTILDSGAATFANSVTATAFFTSSDKRKKDIISQDGDLATYQFKGDNQIHYGYIAQEMEALYPNQVSTDNDGMMSLNYIEILVKKVHDLETKLKKHGLD